MPIIAALVGIVLGAIAAIAYMRTAKQGSLHEADEKIQSAHAQAESLIGDAKRQAETLKKEALLEAKEEIIKNKQAAEAEDKQRKNEIRTLENRVMQREESTSAATAGASRKPAMLPSATTAPSAVLEYPLYCMYTAAKATHMQKPIQYIPCTAA